MRSSRGWCSSRRRAACSSSRASAAAAVFSSSRSSRLPAAAQACVRSRPLACVRSRAQACRCSRRPRWPRRFIRYPLNLKSFSPSLFVNTGDRNGLFPWHVWGGVQATFKNEETRSRGTGRGLKKSHCKISNVFNVSKVLDGFDPRCDRHLPHSARQRWRNCTHQLLLRQRFKCHLIFFLMFFVSLNCFLPRLYVLLWGNHCGCWNMFYLQEITVVAGDGKPVKIHLGGENELEDCRRQVNLYIYFYIFYILFYI